MVGLARAAAGMVAIGAAIGGSLGVFGAVRATMAQPEDAAARMPADVRAVLERAQRAYGAASSYSDRAEITFDFRGKDRAGEAVEQSSTNELEFRFQRPGRFAITADELRIVSDGETIWAVMDELKQYTQQKAPDDIDTVIGGDLALSLLQQHRPAMVLLSRAGGPVERFFRIGTTFKSLQREPLRGRAGAWVRGTTDPAMPGLGSSPFSAWFNEQTGLLEEVRIDLTATYAQMVAAAEGEDVSGMPRTITRAEAVYTFNDIRLDEPAPAGTFVFKPGKGMRRVEVFEMGMPGGGAQMALIGQEAPVFTGQTLSGDELSLEALRGKVVVLDFWATWCAPCVAIMPQIQRLTERFAGRNVVVIGINQDRAGSEEKVREFIAARDVNFRQILDFEGEVGRAYRVAAIPCTVIIDQRGVIQDIHLGGEQELESKLAQRIETVLRGERIHDDEALARYAQGVDEHADDEDGGGDDQGPQTINGTLIAEGERTPGVSAAAGARRIDLDGDGLDELLAADFGTGGLVVVSADGADVRKIRLRGAPRGFVGTVAPANLGSARGWLVAGAEGYGETPRAVVRYHDAEGELVWTFKVPTAEGTTAQVPYLEAIDLDGDSRVEIVALATSFPSQGSPSPSSSRAWLYVLDSAGNVVAARQVGSIASGAFVGEPGADGVRSVVVLADNAVKRFTFDNRKR